MSGGACIVTVMLDECVQKYCALKAGPYYDGLCKKPADQMVLLDSLRIRPAAVEARGPWPATAWTRLVWEAPLATRARAAGRGRCLGLTLGLL